MLDRDLTSKIMKSADDGFGEQVDLESVRRVTQAMALFVAEWCGVERA